MQGDTSEGSASRRFDPSRLASDSFPLSFVQIFSLEASICTVNSDLNQAGRCKLRGPDDMTLHSLKASRLNASPHFLSVWHDDEEQNYR